MIHPFLQDFFLQVDKTLIDNGDGTFSVRTTSLTGGSATNPKGARNSEQTTLAGKLFTDASGTISLNVA